MWLKRSYRIHDHRHVWNGLPKLLVFNQVVGQVKEDQSNQLTKLNYSTTHGMLNEFPMQVTQVSLKSLINAITSTTKPILIKGLQGHGKSLLISQICLYWAQLFGLRKYLLVFWVNLAAYISTPATLDQLMQTLLPASFDTKLVSKWIEKAEGDNVIFMIDGWSQNQEIAGHNMFSRLLSRSYLKKSTIVVTSTFSPIKMPSHVPLDRRGTWQIVPSYIQFDILGLTPAQINRQVISYYTDNQVKAEEFLHYIASHPDIKQLTSIPVYLYGILYLFDNVPVSELPVTWTELCSCMTLLLMNPLFPDYQIVNHIPQYLNSFPQHLPNPLKTFVSNFSQFIYFGFERGDGLYWQSQLPTAQLPQLTLQEHTGFSFFHPEYAPLADTQSEPLRLTFPLLRNFFVAIYLHTLSFLDQQTVMENKPDEIFLWQLYSGLIPVNEHHKYFSTMLNAGCLDTIPKLAHCSYETGQPVEIKMNFKNLALSGLDMHHSMFSCNVLSEIAFHNCALGSDALLHLSKHELYILQQETAAQNLFIQ